MYARRSRSWPLVLATLSTLAAVCALTARASAYGEEKAGFPNWEERVLLEWTNRARVEPSTEMTKCGAPCAEGACYKPVGPVYYNEQLNHSARFHSDEQVKQGYFAHDSKCTVPATIKDTYPTTCDGSASCACSGSTPTSWSARVSLFGAGPSGEIIASPSDPESAFYLWLFEPATVSTCGYSGANGHRYNILTAGPDVGYGVSGYSTGDFGGGGTASKVPSGSHYPRGGPSVDLWVNWFDSAAPSLAQVNVAGTCSALTRARGTDVNGAWTYKASGLSGCTRYYFAFKDAGGATVTYPTSGSLGIGDTSCAVWDSTRPAAGSGCDCTPSCSGKTCGDNGCGGSCGSCASGTTCSGGSCVATCAPSCAGKACGSDGCGGSCGSCAAGTTCSAAGSCTSSCTPSCAGKSCGSDGCGGSCGSCASPKTCTAAGACGCSAPSKTCAGVCLDVSSDPDHCGDCATKCAASEVCSKGACSGSCTAPLIACNRACVDAQSDPAHCGACDVACRADETCSLGGCASATPDAGPITGDASTRVDDAPDDTIHGSCACRLASARSSSSTEGGVAAIAALASFVLRARRRRR